MQPENQQPPQIPNPAPQPSPQKPKSKWSEKLLIIFAVGATAIGLLIFIPIIAFFIGVNHHCDNQKRETTAEIERQAKAFNNLVIISGQPTDGTTNDSGDCLTGGPGSVYSSAEFTVNKPYPVLQTEITNNLAKAGYQPISKLDPQDTGPPTSDGIEQFKDLKAYYKTKDDKPLAITYQFSTPYPFICPDGAKICNDPDLQAIQAATVIWVGVDTGSTATPIE